jgi:hypothetical protein
MRFETPHIAARMIGMPHMRKPMKENCQKASQEEVAPHGAMCNTMLAKDEPRYIMQYAKWNVKMVFTPKLREQPQPNIVVGVNGIFAMASWRKKEVALSD